MTEKEEEKPLSLWVANLGKGKPRTDDRSMIFLPYPAVPLDKIVHNVGNEVNPQKGVETGV